MSVSDSGKLETHFTKNSTSYTSPPLKSIFLRRLSFVDLNNIKETGTLHSLAINKSKVILIYNSKTLGESQSAQLMSEFAKMGRYLELNSQNEKDLDPQTHWVNQKFFLGLYDTYLNR